MHAIWFILQSDTKFKSTKIFNHRWKINKVGLKKICKKILHLLFLHKSVWRCGKQPHQEDPFGFYYFSLSFFLYFITKVLRHAKQKSQWLIKFFQRSTLDDVILIASNYKKCIKRIKISRKAMFFGLTSNNKA